MNLFDLTGTRAIVVGGAGDLGFSMLEALVEQGATAAVIGRGERCELAAKQLCERGFSVTGVFADLADRAQIDRSFREAVEAMGGVDILVNAAGIQRRHSCLDFPVEDWDEVLEINLTATFLYCQLAAREMVAGGAGQGSRPRGKIINVASLISVFGGLTIPAYAASKGGVMQLTKSLSNEWASQGINVNSIAPGYMDTKMNTALIEDPERSRSILSRIPQQRWGRGEDMKGATVFLASAASDYVNGTMIAVDGGYMGC